MKISYFVLLAFFLSTQTFAEPLPADTPAMMAELLFVAGHAPTFKALESTTLLTEIHRADVQRYIKSHGLADVALPAMEWKIDSPVVTIRQGAKSLKIDFSKMPTTKQIVINGKTLTIQPNATVEQVTDQISRARTERHAWETLFSTEAEAADSSQGMDFLTAFGYYTGMDQVNACMGNESISISTCKFKLNSSMILADISKLDDELMDFQCEGGKFKSATVEGSYKLRIDAAYDDKGDMTKLTTSQSGGTTCVYKMKDGKLEKLDYAVTDSYCDGRTEGDLNQQKHPLKSGDVPKRIATTYTPIQRVKDCCQNKGCQKTLMEAAAKNRERSLPPTTNSNSAQ